MSLSRRTFLAGAAVAGLAAPAAAQGIFARPDAAGQLAFPPAAQPHPDFRALLTEKVTIRSVDLYQLPKSETVLVRVLREDGAEGVVRASTKVEHTGQFFRDFAVPRFIGTDARNLADTIRRAAREDYEYAGLPYWATLGQVEIAIWDLLGKTLRQPCAAVIGPVLHRSIPIYMSSNKRDTSPDAEIAHLQERVAETGARCVKVKIGRRMGYNTDMQPGRSEAVIAALRKAFGDAMTIYADANGAYDLPMGLEIAAMLEDHGVALLEEPCPFEDFEMTAQLSAAIRQKGYKLKVAGGENDYALERWRWLTANRAFDAIQPDPMYAGGIFRNLAIMEMGRAAGLLYNPHFPRNGADSAPMLQLCAGAANLWGYQEYRSREDKLDFAHSPVLTPVNGEVTVPVGPGWGIEYDPGIWQRARKL